MAAMVGTYRKDLTEGHGTAYLAPRSLHALASADIFARSSRGANIHH